MLWSLVSVAFAGDLILSVKVTGGGGNVLLQDELVLPADRQLATADQKGALVVTGRMFDSDGAVIELVTGPVGKDGKPKPKLTKSYELEVYQPKSETITYKKETWTVETTLGEVWDSPEPAAAPADSGRYVLVWDDAGLIRDPKKLEDPKTVKDPKKLAKATAEEVTKERELPEGRTDPMTQASPMKIVNMYSDKIIELEAVPADAAGHCVTGGAPAEGAAPTAFVAIKDFVPRLTAREVVGKNPDGTGYRVAAGLPVVPEGPEGTYRVTTGGLSFLIQATEEDLAFYYRPSAHFETGDAPHRLPAGTLGKLGEGEVTWAGPDGIPVAAMRGVTAPVATVRVPCAEVRVTPDTSALIR
jgi:hypothetical protein